MEVPKRSKCESQCVQSNQLLRRGQSTIQIQRLTDMQITDSVLTMMHAAIDQAVIQLCTKLNQ